MSSKTPQLRPIVLYDHLPGILAGYPAVLFALLALLSWIPTTVIDDSMIEKLEAARIQVAAEQQAEDIQAAKERYQDADERDKAIETIKQKADPIQKLMETTDYHWLNRTQPMFDSHMLFWVGLSIMLIWYIAFRFNMPKGKFLLMFFMFCTFVGGPVLLEMLTSFKLFTWSGKLLGSLEPAVNTGAWIVMSLVFFAIWLGNFIYSRTHMRVVIDESGLTVNRVGGKGERFELIGLKTENEPLDYLELFLAGVGSLSLKTRMNKPIFTMKRVIGLYWLPWLPFAKGKLALIEEMLSYQGKVVSVDRSEAAEMADADTDADGDGDSDGHDVDDVLDGDGNDGGSDFDRGGSESSSIDDRGID